MGNCWKRRFLLNTDIIDDTNSVDYNSTSVMSDDKFKIVEYYDMYGVPYKVLVDVTKNKK